MQRWFPPEAVLKRWNAKGGPPKAARPLCERYEALGLLDLDRRALGLELALGVVGHVLRDLLQDRRRRALHEVLGLLEAEARDRADRLDDVDLLVADGGEDHVELGLLLGGLGARCAGAGRRHHHGRRGRGRDIEGLLELLDEVGQLEKGHLLEAVEQVLGLDLGHRYSSSFFGSFFGSFCASFASARAASPASSLAADSGSGAASGSVATSARGSADGSASAGAASSAGASAATSAGASAATSAGASATASAASFSL